MTEERLRAPHAALKWTYGLVPFLAGLDKFFFILADWSAYLSPAVADLLPVSPVTFMSLVGVVEMAVGVLVLTRWTRLGATLAGAWLAAIAVNLVLLGALDIAVRDLAMAVGAFTLARLDEVLATSPKTAPSRSVAHSTA